MERFLITETQCARMQCLEEFVNTFDEATIKRNKW